MPLYWFWEDISPVHRLRDEYNELIEYINTQIKSLQYSLDAIKSNSNDIHKQLNSYRSASGEMAELYYEKVIISETKFKNIISSCEEDIAVLRRKRNEAQRIKDELQHYYNNEKNGHKEYSLGAIGL